MKKINRRQFLYGSLLSSAALLQACGSTAPKTGKINSPPIYYGAKNNTIRFFASSGFVEDSSRISLALSRLNRAGFHVTNPEVAYRRYRRFAGTEHERVNDFQAIATGKVNVPKLLLGVRGGYGAMQLLPYIDWASLGAKMREHGTIMMGFSDATALSLALLTKGKMLSFCGPMVYSEFGNPNVAEFTMRSFVEGVSNKNLIIYVNSAPLNHEIEGIFWGGNLTVLASLIGTPYMPDIKGGILFIEDVSEQPYKIERNLQSLYLSGILQKQKAIVMGDFRMGNMVDAYDSSYDLYAVIATIRRLTKIPILTGFPFGHIRNKATMPLGAVAKIRPSSFGYSVGFSAYPVLDAKQFNLSSLLYIEEPLFDNPQLEWD